MEGLAALSLASSIVQLVDFGCRCYAAGKEIYQSSEGATAEHVELGNITTRLQDLSLDLETDERKNVPQSLVRLASQAREVAVELLVKLGKTKATGSKARRREASTKMLKSLWHQKEIKSLSDRLEQLRSQLMLELLFLIQDQRSSVETRLREEAPLLSEQDMTISVENSQVSQALSVVATQMQSEDPSTINLSLIDCDIHRVKRKIDRLSRQVRVLNSLTFPNMAGRREAVDNAHKNTYSWILYEESDHESGTFVSWLRHHSGIFWITGKPGSGKSTLAKFLSDNLRTRDILERWADKQRLVLADFYFWKPGTEYQKTQEGLLRAILYQIYLNCPELIDQTLPSKLRSKAFLLSADWTVDDILYALDSVSSQTTDSIKFCFFVDGLDEYNATMRGGYRGLVNTIRRLAGSWNVKICVTSRPYNIFVDEFGQNQDLVLQMHSLTSGDMAIYVRDYFTSHPKFHRNLELDPHYGILESQIVKKAQGVFLWVVLTTRTLLEGLDNDDDVSMLQARLATIPSELEVLFQSMIDNTEKVYRDDAIRIYRLLLDRGSSPVWLVNMLFDPLFEHELRKNHLINSLPYRHQLCKRAEARVRARCRDLLHIHLDNDPRRWYTKVDFIHRTVYDFMLEYDYESALLNKRTLAFNPFIFSCFAFIDLTIFEEKLERNKPTGRPVCPDDFSLCLAMTNKNGMLLPRWDPLSVYIIEEVAEDGRSGSIDKIDSVKKSFLEANRITLKVDGIPGGELWTDEHFIRGVFIDKGTLKQPNNLAISIPAAGTDT